MENVDLLVEDIFGKEGCGFIGLPPKIIASSLGKYASAQQALGSVWDRLKSLLISFGLNLAQQINKQSDMLQVPNVLFLSHDFHAPAFLNLVQLSRAQLWFHPNGMAADFARLLHGHTH